MIGSAVSIEHAVFIVEGLCKFISSELHALEFLGLPPVHFEGADERDVHAEIAMDASALVAEEDADIR